MINIIIIIIVKLCFIILSIHLKVRFEHFSLLFVLLQFFKLITQSSLFVILLGYFFELFELECFFNIVIDLIFYNIPTK